MLCSRGLLLVLNWGKRRWGSIRKALLVTGVMPMHKAVSKMNYNFIVTNERKHEPLMRHFQYLLELGEVRATRTVTTLVDGMAGRANHDDDADATFLPRYLAVHGIIGI